jgi:hypothetical protein
MQYIGTTIVEAYEGMTLGEYNSTEGISIFNNIVPDHHSGVLVTYNTGHTSWCPKDVFFEGYRSMRNLNFGDAIHFLKEGKKLARAGWNGKNMFVVFMAPMYLPPFSTQDTDRKVNDRTAKWIGENTPLDSQGYFAMFNAQGQWQPGWAPSQSDMLANDWSLVK